MESIHNWSVKRSGASMTIDGIDGNGRPVKITGVSSVKTVSDRASGGQSIQATTEDNGVVYDLSVQAR